MIDPVQIEADEHLCDAATEEHDCSKHGPVYCSFKSDLDDTHLAMARKLPEYIAEVKRLAARLADMRKLVTP